MADAQEIFDALCEPFPIDFVSWRIGSTNADKTKGMALCYLDARAVMDRLDSICGPAGWQCKYSMIAGIAICDLGIRLDGEWIWKADGAGATDVEGEKGMLSDALKRAAVRWGIGRYLYDLDSPWVPITKRGNSYMISDEERGKLDHFYEANAPKVQWGVRAGVQAYRLLNQGILSHVTQAADAEKFRADNAGMIAQLPVAMRKHINQTLDRVGASQREAAE